MQRLSFKLTVALLTFIVGVTAATVGYFRFAPAESQPTANVVSPAVNSIAEPSSSYDPCAFRRPGGGKLEAQEAVRVAECFIIRNGYTDLPPMEDKSKLTPESVFPGTDEHGMQMRHDSLERRAYGVMRSGRHGGGWTVAFRYRVKPDVVEFYGDRLATIGRAVTMDARGGQMRIEHSDFFLNFPELQRVSF